MQVPFGYHAYSVSEDKSNCAQQKLDEKVHKKQQKALQNVCTFMVARFTTCKILFCLKQSLYKIIFTKLIFI